MKKVNVSAYSIKGVKEAVNFAVEVNATTAWKKAGSPEPDSDGFDAFATEYLQKKKVEGAYVVIEAGREDSRENPYDIKNVKSVGKRKMKRVYELIDTNTQEILGVADDKESAKALAREIVREKRDSLVAGTLHECRVKMVVEEGTPVAFTFSYVPGANTKLGSYVAFGV
jgi:hypothetical protein